MTRTIVATLVAFWICGIAAPVHAQGNSRAVLSVEVTGLHSAKGQVLIAVFAAEKGFPSHHEHAVRTATVSIQGTAASARFEGLPDGEYAVAVLHDENANGKMDRNPFGIPSEGYGASRDARAVFGPPKYDDARFPMKAPGLTVRIGIRY